MKKKLVSIALIAVAASVLIFAGLLYINRAHKKADIPTMALAKSDLVDSVLASGTVISSNSKDIYSKSANYPVKEVFVKVGDKVRAGDVLAALDTASLESDIKQTELNIKNAEASLQNDESAIQSSLENAENSVKLAALDLDTAQRNYNETKDLYEAAAATQDQFQQAESALKKAQLSYDNAQIALKSSQSKTTSTSGTNIEIQKVALEKQKKALSDASITAPIDGTVTLSNAKAGESSTGLLFIVEDTENLIVSTSIGEYDINLIKTGQQVAIKSDSTGDKEFIGTVSKIAPAAERDSTGSISSSNVLFDTEVTMNSNDSNIKIGMNVRLTIKLNEKKNVFSVPYDSIITDNDGSKWISVLDTTGKTRKSAGTVKRIKVTTGMETDMSVEIQGAELKDGLNVITSPQSIPGTAKQGADQ